MGNYLLSSESFMKSVHSRVGRFWVLRKVRLFLVPLGAKGRNEILKNYFDPKTNERYQYILFSKKSRWQNIRIQKIFFLQHHTLINLLHSKTFKL